ncbi:TetR/AcrR family transcriptional regulator [Nocardia wallacei]|uniref:TetR/AcrR family transcriptional regulator n=1 Tax=Nocardia wallacei TaxID=480035 RepID=UPI002458824B|nr:helix-turn-helix domain-containing protein [Nocardia wallacei]
MPRNRRPRDADQKRGEIVAAAQRLFRDLGYDKASMARIADGAGVTANTVYWYFRSKDEVLIAVLDEDFSAALTRYEELRNCSLVERLHWVVRRLRDIHTLVDTVHARASLSPAIAEWHDRFHATTDRMLAEELRASGAPESTVAAAAKNITFVIEALLTHPQDETTERTMLELLLRSAVPA